MGRRRVGWLDWKAQAAWVSSAASSLVAAIQHDLRRLAFPNQIAAPQIHPEISGRLSDRDFHKLVSKGFEQQGFDIESHSTPALDGTLIVSRGSSRFVVHCRHSQTAPLTLGMMQEVHESMRAARISSGFVLTSGNIGKRVRRFAARRHIELIAGRELDALLKAGRDRIAFVIFQGAAANGPEFSPYCPACKTPMVVRTAKRGMHTQSFFWVCAQGATCRQTMVMWSEGRRSA